jgi:hypothetical protein
MQTRQQMADQPPPSKVKTILFALVFLVLSCAKMLVAADTPAPSEEQVKAVFLFNFAKYVDWPPDALPGNATPITIGVIGTDSIGDDLQHDVEGKTINGHPFVIKHMAWDAEWSGCQILFISRSEAARTGEILDKASTLPILTVGESEAFARNGGIVNFVLKNGNVRLSINLNAARKAGLNISSRLLAVADVVKGKHD